MKGSKKLKGLKPDFDVEIIPQEFDYYGNISFSLLDIIWQKREGIIKI